MGKKSVTRFWKIRSRENGQKKEKAKIVYMPRGYYLVQFSDANDYQHALFEVPWRVADHYILVQHWRPGFLHNAEFERHVAVWIRILDLSTELYNEQFLRCVGAMLVGMLEIDRVTSIQSRGQFARICVELDLAKPLLPNFIARGIMFNLEYEGLHMICFRCGNYGHKENGCMEATCKATTGSEQPKGEGRSVMDTSQAQPKQTRAEVSMDQKDLTSDMQAGGSKGEQPYDYGTWMIKIQHNVLL